MKKVLAWLAWVLLAVTGMAAQPMSSVQLDASSDGGPSFMACLTPDFDFVQARRVAWYAKPFAYAGEIVCGVAEAVKDTAVEHPGKTVATVVLVKLATDEGWQDKVSEVWDVITDQKDDEKPDKEWVITQDGEGNEADIEYDGDIKTFDIRQQGKHNKTKITKYEPPEED